MQIRFQSRSSGMTPLSLKTCELERVCICPFPPPPSKPNIKWWYGSKIIATDTLISKWVNWQMAHSSQQSIAVLTSRSAHTTSYLLSLKSTPWEGSPVSPEYILWSLSSEIQVIRKKWPVYGEGNSSSCFLESIEDWEAWRLSLWNASAFFTPKWWHF